MAFNKKKRDKKYSFPYYTREIIEKQKTNIKTKNDNKSYNPIHSRKEINKQQVKAATPTNNNNIKRK